MEPPSEWPTKYTADLISYKLCNLSMINLKSLVKVFNEKSTGIGESDSPCPLRSKRRTPKESSLDLIHWEILQNDIDDEPAPWQNITIDDSGFEGGM